MSHRSFLCRALPFQCHQGPHWACAAHRARQLNPWDASGPRESRPKHDKVKVWSSWFLLPGFTVSSFCSTIKQSTLFVQVPFAAISSGPALDRLRIHPPCYPQTCTDNSLSASKVKAGSPPRSPEPSIEYQVPRRPCFSWCQKHNDLGNTKGIGLQRWCSKQQSTDSKVRARQTTWAPYLWTH